jgi:hypothetical protein
LNLQRTTDVILAHSQVATAPTRLAGRGFLQSAGSQCAFRKGPGADLAIWLAVVNLGLPIFGAVPAFGCLTELMHPVSLALFAPGVPTIHMTTINAELGER